jgi:hypothetical protein
MEVLLRAYLALLDGEEGYREVASEALSLSTQQWEEVELAPQLINFFQETLIWVETDDFPK